MRRLPPLNAARAFEAVARLGSLTRASAELHVTHGALSRQVALLEQWAGQPLFIRTPSSTLVPTEVGRRYGQELTALLDQLAAISVAATETAGKVITVTAAPTFTMHWLIPRMSAYQRAHPDVTVKLATSSHPAQLHEGGSDIVIHSVRVKQDRVSCLPFMDDYYVPVCHADLIEKVGCPDASWLESQTLLSYGSWPDSWELWAEATGIGALPQGRRQQFEQMFLSRQAVLEGLGVAILPIAVVLDDIVQGKLAVPLQLRGARHQPWLACYHQARAADPVVAGFLEWLQVQARDFQHAAGACFAAMGWTRNPFAEGSQGWQEI
jgi:LysR family transcriptional regulator, glycine cleavage system transcriptional activator